LRLIDVANSAGRKTGNASDCLQSKEGLHRAPGVGFGVRVFSGRIAKGLRGAIEAGAKSIIVADLLPRAFEDARAGKLHLAHKAMAMFSGRNLLLVIGGFFFKGQF
jgi:hypothetical protein